MTSYFPVAQFRIVNQTVTPEPISVIVFGKNAAAPEAIPVAWRVISNTTPGTAVPFDYPALNEVCASDSFGNTTALVIAQDGDAFNITAPDSGLQLQSSGNGVSPAEITVSNAAARPMNVMFCKDNKKLFQQTGLPAGQAAVFVNENKLYLAIAAGNVQEGDIVDATLLAHVTEIGLWGLRTADFVLYGGGSGTAAKPYMFNVENIT